MERLSHADWLSAVDRIDDVAKLFFRCIESCGDYTLHDAGHYFKPVEAMEYLTALADTLWNIERATDLARKVRERRQHDAEQAEAAKRGKAVPS